MKDIEIKLTEEQFQTVLDALWAAREVYTKYGESKDELKCVQLWKTLYNRQLSDVVEV